jgi:hypothetical protein
MCEVGFEPMIAVFEQAKIFHALDLVATVVGCTTLRITGLLDFIHCPEFRILENSVF